MNFTIRTYSLVSDFDGTPLEGVCVAPEAPYAIVLMAHGMAEQLCDAIQQRQNLQQLPRYCGTPSDSQTRRLRSARVDTFDRSALYY